MSDDSDADHALERYARREKEVKEKERANREIEFRHRKLMDGAP